jgi:hypothetical protein
MSSSLVRTTLLPIENTGDEMITFTDFLPVPDPSRTKVKFNMRAGVGGSAAWDLLLDDEEGWLDLNRYRDRGPSNTYGNAKYVLTFAQLPSHGPQYFVFGGFYEVTALEPTVYEGTGYALRPMPQHAEYIKRLVIRLAKPIGRDVYLRRYESLQDGPLNPEVFELSPQVKLGGFPGYQHVLLSHASMQRIISYGEPSWREALSSVKGVYVITDTATGKLYVGSASAESDGLWGRWSDYANVRNLTGGNKEFEALRQTLGDDYIVANFQYTILEVFDPKTRPELILQRENFWKKALVSRHHGMNHN